MNNFIFTKSVCICKYREHESSYSNNNNNNNNNIFFACIKEKIKRWGSALGGVVAIRTSYIITIICAMIMMCEPEVNHNTLIVS